MNIEFTVYATQDDIPVRGNAMASGDAAADRKCEDEILDRLDAGDVWAWASVRVRGEIDGVYYDEYLGGCSYADEEDFRSCGYFTDMCAEITSKFESLREALT